MQLLWDCFNLRALKNPDVPECVCICICVCVNGILCVFVCVGSKPCLQAGSSPCLESVSCCPPGARWRPFRAPWQQQRDHPLPTVHLCGFSPVCRRMWTTSMYWALKGFCSREQSSQRHTNSFLSPWMWSLLMCCVKQRHAKMRGRGFCPLSVSHVSVQICLIRGSHRMTTACY